MSLYRVVFGYDRHADLRDGPLVNWNGVRLHRDDAPRGNSVAYRLNTSVVLSEMGERARLAYAGAKRLLPSGSATEEERRWGAPAGTAFAMSAERSRAATQNGEPRDD